MHGKSENRSRVARKPGIRHLTELQRKERLLSSIHKISSLLTRPISLDKILTSIVEETSSAFGFTRVALFLVDKSRKLLECRYLIGFGPEERERALSRPFHLDRHSCIETRVIRSGKTIFIRDHRKDPRLSETDMKVSLIQNRVSTLAVPLKIKEDVIGLIEADKNDVKLDITQADMRAFSTFANQASIVIENAKLQDQNNKKIRQLLSLQEVSKNLISSSLNLKSLLDIISINALKITVASTCALLLVDKETNSLKIMSQIGYSDQDMEHFSLAVGTGISGWVAANGVPLLVMDVSDEPRYVEVIKGVQSELAVPLMAGNEVLGVLNVDSYRRAAFSDDDIEILMIFARHAAVLIDKVRLYEQITTERNLAENILESSPNGLVTTDCDLRIRSMNRKAKEIFGVGAASVIGQRVSEIFEDAVSDVFGLAYKDGIVVDNLEVKLDRNGPGSPAALGISTSLLKTREQRVTGVIATIQDLTEVKKTEELIRRMDRLSSLGQLSAGIAHEIRNPLASINFNVQMLSKKLPKDDSLSVLINDTMEGIDRIKVLVKGVLDFARPRTPALRQGELLDVVSDSVALMRPQFAEKNIDVRIDFSEDMPRIIFDPHLIHQVFINIILNSIEAMPEGGIVSIRSGLERTHTDESPQLVVYVEDTGIGIPQEIRPKIFDPFFTTKPDGTGLGLSIVHKIMEQHNASIDFISEVDRGATFILRFPVQPKASFIGSPSR